MKKLFFGLMAAAMLTGCGAQIAPTAVDAPHASVSNRRVLAAPGSTALWGVNFFQSSKRSSGVRKVRGITGSGRSSYDYFPYDYTVDDTYTVYSGKGDLERLSIERYAFVVPEGEVLVINQLSGKGVLYINGYAFSLTGESRPVHYLFGAGQLVVIRFVPTLESLQIQDGKGWTITTTKHYDMGISGFLGDPALISGSAAPK